MTDASTVDLDRMRPPHEARAIVDEHTAPLGTESLPLLEAIGRALAQDIVALEPHPPFPASTMDGYAVVAEDSSPWREVIGEQHAGHILDVEVTEGYTVKIMTGAPLPPGSNAVVPVEATELMEDHVVIHQEEVKTGENVRAIGSDLKQGELILPSGTTLGPAEIGLVANVGVNPVLVHRIPKVCVLSTGDELVEPGDPVGPGQIRDSNRFSLVAALMQEPCEITFAGKSPDDREELETFLRKQMEQNDIIITSGGVSMGDKDLIKAILFDAPDVEVHFRRLFLKPGKPLNFATCGNTRIFGLPGNPVSSLVTFEVFIRPAIRQMAGFQDIDRPLVRVTLEHGTPSADRIEYQRAVVTANRDGQLSARNTGTQQSSRLASFVGMNALLIIPPREHPYQPGEMVDAMLIHPPVAEV